MPFLRNFIVVAIMSFYKYVTPSGVIFNFGKKSIVFESNSVKYKLLIIPNQ